jgi:hypothetical protein
MRPDVIVAARLDARKNLGHHRGGLEQTGFVMRGERLKIETIRKFHSSSVPDCGASTCDFELPLWKDALL